MELPPKFAGRVALSPDEAAEVLGVDRSTFYRRVMPAVRAGTIQSFKVGACRRILAPSYLRWLEKQATN